MSDIDVFIPVAETRIESGALAPRLATLKGARIGWLDNMKANAGALLDALADVCQKGGIAFERIAMSKDATAAAPPDVMTHLQTCDAVVLAIAD